MIHIKGVCMCYARCMITTSFTFICRTSVQENAPVNTELLNVMASDGDPTYGVPLVYGILGRVVIKHPFTTVPAPF